MYCSIYGSTLGRLPLLPPPSTGVIFLRRHPTCRRSLFAPSNSHLTGSRWLPGVLPRAQSDTATSPAPRLPACSARLAGLLRRFAASRRESTRPPLAALWPPRGAPLPRPDWPNSAAPQCSRGLAMARNVGLLSPRPAAQFQPAHACSMAVAAWRCFSRPIGPICAAPRSHRRPPMVREVGHHSQRPAPRECSP